MEESKGNKLKLLEGGKKEKEKQAIYWHIRIVKVNGEIREFDDVVSIEPTTSGLLAISSIYSGIVVIPFARIDEYSLKQIPNDEEE